jgi:hypothetical protein
MEAQLGGSVLSSVCQLENALVRGGSVVDACFASAGKEITLNDYFPYASDWGLPATIKVQGAIEINQVRYYFGVNPAQVGTGGQYILTQKAYAGGVSQLVFIDRVKNAFFYLTSSDGSGTMSTITAFNGTLPGADGTVVGAFESVTIRYYPSGTSPITLRMKSNGTHIYVQYWIGKVPGMDGFDASTTTSFNGDKCIKLNTTLPNSTYEEADTCVTAFGAATEAALAADTSYRLRLGVDSIKKDQWVGKASMFDPDVHPIGAGNACY